MQVNMLSISHEAFWISNVFVEVTLDYRYSWYLLLGVQKCEEYKFNIKYLNIQSNTIDKNNFPPSMGFILLIILVVCWHESLKHERGIRTKLILIRNLSQRGSWTEKLILGERERRRCKRRGRWFLGGGDHVGLFLASRRVGTRRRLIVFARFYVGARASRAAPDFPERPIVPVILFILLFPTYISTVPVQFDRSFDVKPERPVKHTVNTRRSWRTHLVSDTGTQNYRLQCPLSQSL